MPLWPRSKANLAAKLDQLIALQQETNGLLRELAASTGLVLKTRKPWTGPIRQSTDKDVRYFSRADRLKQQQEPEEPIPDAGPDLTRT